MRKSTIVLSGGQDSATTLAYAATTTQPTIAIHYQYGQRHHIEHQSAQRWADQYRTPLITIPVPALTIGDSALTHPGDINATHPTNPNLPASFVPGRNLIFLTLAAAIAIQHDAPHIFTGICETDATGYPDCRQTTIDALQQTLRHGLDAPQITIHTPLMRRTKADTFRLAEHLGVLPDILEHTHTCYEGDRTHRHAWGYGCGTCTACKVRSAGWSEYQTTC